MHCLADSLYTRIFSGGTTMDKKTKKRLDVVRQRLQVLQKNLAGARKQNDEPGEVERLAAEIAKLEAEVETLKKS